jgi:hypothetical protein
MDPNALNQSCVSVNLPWSIIETAQTNSHLAALLAGFMITAIIFLLAPGINRGKYIPAHTIALFAVGLVILGLDSYFFGLIGAERPAPSGDGIKPGTEYVCAVMWTQSQAASGMLAVGTTLMVAGLGWMLTGYAKTEEVRSTFFGTLGNLLTLIMIATTTLLLILVIGVYIRVMDLNFGINLGRFTTAIVAGAGAISGVVSCGMVALRTIGIVRRLKVNPSWANELEPRYKTLAAACLLTALFAFAAPLSAPLLAEPHLPSKTAMWISIILCVFVPCLIYLAVGYSVPGPPSWWEAHPERADQRAVPTANTDQ